MLETSLSPSQGNLTSQRIRHCGSPKQTALNPGVPGWTKTREQDRAGPLVNRRGVNLILHLEATPLRLLLQLCRVSGIVTLSDYGIFQWGGGGGFAVLLT